MKKNKPKIYRNFSVKLNYVHWAIELLLQKRTALKINANHYQLSTINYPLILFFALLTITGCKCKKDCDDAWNPDCSNYDPCYGKSDNTADFWIYENNMGIYWANEWNDGLFDNMKIYWPYYDADTVWSDVTLVAKDSTCDEYIWEVGAGVYHERTLSLSDYPVDAVTEVKLTTIKNVDRTCYPEGRDTLSMTRTFYKKKWDTSAYDPIEGLWYGHNTDSPSKMFTFSIEKAPDLTFHPYPFDIDDYVFKHFPEPEIIMPYHTYPDTIGYSFQSSANSYRQVYFYFEINNFSRVMNPFGYLRVYGKNNDSIYVNYMCLPDTTYDTYRDEHRNPNVWRHREFYGVRVP